MFTEHPASVTVNQGQGFNLSCSARGNPTPMITWYKNDALFLVIIPQDGVLIFPRASEEDAGVYKCRTFNSTFQPIFSQPAIVDIRCKYNQCHIRGPSTVPLYCAECLISFLLIIENGAVQECV